MNGILALILLIIGGITAIFLIISVIILIIDLFRLPFTKKIKFRGFYYVTIIFIFFTVIIYFLGK